MVAREANAVAELHGRDGAPERIRSFFAERIWNVRLRDLGWGRALLYRLARIAYATMRGFIEHRVTIRAAALTYDSTLSLVPFLAFAFAVLKGLGAYSALVDATLRPYIHRTFGANKALVEASDQILRSVSRTNVSTLGAVGLLVLLYTSVSLLSSIEDALNEAWGVAARRSPLRQLTNYVTLLVTAPLLILAAATLATAAHSSAVVIFLQHTLALGSVLEFLLRFTSVAVVWVALLAIYLILPNVRVRVPSALFGAAVSAILWQGALFLYVRLQMGVTEYSAVYSALGAVPIFLVWTYVSWIVVLIGAQVAASYEGHRAFREQLDTARADQALREDLAVLVAALVAWDFLSKGVHPTESELAMELDLPEPLVRNVVDVLVRSEILARTVGASQPGCVPNRDPGSIHLWEIQAALRQDERAEPLREQLRHRFPAQLGLFIRETDKEARNSKLNVSLNHLAAMLAPDLAADPARSEHERRVH
ncbi:MAG TPA: YihY/virulence factor BrkB family protein [Anaeromyxobacteraceae bacterium]|nr:YihY/virulence factor BrkB family protein [Anaeromyxobacteraceae bacterium]